MIRLNGPIWEGPVRRTEQLQGLRMLKLKDVLGGWEVGRLSQFEAAEVLGMSERTFRRWARRFEEEGEEGLLDRRIGRRSGRAVPDTEADEVERLYRERYAGFTAKHFHEYLKATHGFAFGYTWTKTFLQGRGLIPKAPRRGAHRRRRPRRPMIGMMLHQDGSRHAWLESQAPLDLVIVMEMPPARSTRRSWLKRKAPCRAFSRLPRRSPPTACSARSIPIAAATISTLLWPAARSPKGCQPRSGAPFVRSASSTSPPTRHRPAAAANGCSGRFRIACQRTSSSPASPPSKRPIASSRTPISPLTMLASPRLRPSPARPSCRSLMPSGATCWRSRRSARLLPTTPSLGKAKGCRSRHIPPAPASSKPRCASMDIQTESSPSSMARAVWCAGGLRMFRNQINHSRSAVPRLRRSRRPRKP